jgi:hypothetical protein
MLLSSVDATFFWRGKKYNLINLKRFLDEAEIRRNRLLFNPDWFSSLKIDYDIRIK